MMVCSMVSLPRADDILAGKYRVEQVIGRGGMGVVMAAWHLELDQRVALKFLLPELAEHSEAAERFRREARASAKIKSEHVARVLDVGNLEGGVPFIVMEYLDGRDLALEHRERGPLPVSECIDYVLQAIEAVAEAHAFGIVHRDLKPENLFLARRPDGTHLIKVLDFGISKSIVLASQGRALTHTAIIMGSPFYMSPEQMRAPRSVDARTDIWSIGAILYDLIAGRPPYVAETIPQLCTMMLEGDPAPLSTLRSDLNPQLERVIARCLARDVAQRWSSVAELAVALLPFANRSSRIHVERAGRVLSSAASASRGSAAPMPPPELAPESGGVSFGRDSASAATAEVGAPQRSTTPTQRNWENSRSRRPEGVPRRWIPVAIGTGLVLASAGAWMFTRSASGPAPAPVSSAGVLVSPAAVATAPSTTAESPAATAEVPAQDAPSAASTTGVNGAAPSASSKPALAAPAPPTVRPPDKAPPPRPERSAPSAQPGLTDFGGRR
jgi:serine/threonine-protein kinase